MSLTPVLQLLTILVLGYLSTHFLIGRLQTRFFILTGVEYVLLGVLLGPAVTRQMTPEVVIQLAPVMSLSIGTLGLLYGLQLHVSALMQEGREAARLLFSESLTAAVVVGGTMAGVLWLVDGRPGDLEAWRRIGPAAMALGAAAAVSAPSAIAAVRARFDDAGPLPETLRHVAAHDRAVGIVLFGLIFCLFHRGETTGIRPPTAIEWVAVTIGFGVVIGLLFFLFLGREAGRDRLLLALIGIVVFASGVAYYLHLSPLFVTLLLGAILANTTSLREDLVQVLEGIEKPVFVVVMVFAGAAWDLPAVAAAWPLYAGLAVLYLGLRAASKYAGGYLAYRASETPEAMSPRQGAGLLAQGGVAVAMAVTYGQVYGDAFSTVVVTCLLVSAVVSEFVAPTLTRNLLVDAEQVVPRQVVPQIQPSLTDAPSS